MAKELSLIPELELSRILGGTSSGSSGALPGLPLNPTVAEIADYFQSQGFPMTEDSSGNFHFQGTSGSISLNEVEIFGYNSSGNSGSGSSGNSSGSGSSV